MLERIGNCRIVEEVASGGMAVVYRAVQDPLGRTVAIKALKTSAASEENVATRFEREAKSLANLQHENIIHVYDYHQERGAMFIVMEYVQGIDLYDLLDKSGRLPYDVAAIITMQVARALDYVHYRGIVHRDIKPANIMISRSGGVKVMDFGIAHDTSFERSHRGRNRNRHARVHVSRASARRQARRQQRYFFARCRAVSDGHRQEAVRRGRDSKSAMHKIRLEKHVSVRTLNPDIPRELDRIIDRCLEKQPRDRWRSAQHMVMALERFLAKHVEMNHHARLVLFLRAQNVITDLEAEEYLNPAALGAGGSVLAQPNMQARYVVRTGLVAHGIMLGVMMLMVGLIHVAPLSDTPVTQVASTEKPGTGFLRVDASPWARVQIDGRAVGVTPLAQPIELGLGSHFVSLVHDWYAPVMRSITISPGEPAHLAIDFCRDGTLATGKQLPADACPPKAAP